MKKTLLSSIFVLTGIFTYGQTSQINLDSIATYAYETENVGFKVTLNENGDLQFIKIIDSLKLTKDELYSKVLSYFAYNYKDAKNVLQQQDKENGLIIAKGYFDAFSFHSFNIGSFLTTSYYSYLYSANHTIRVDIKDGRIRYILTIPEYTLDITTVPHSIADRLTTKSIIKCAPFIYDYSAVDKAGKGFKKMIKNLIDNVIESELKGFKALCAKSKATIESFEKTIKEGSSKAEAKDW